MERWPSGLFGSGPGVRDLDIDVQILPGRRVIREIAGRRAAVLEDDVVQDPLPAAIRQIDRQRRGYRVGRILTTLAEMCATI